MLRWAAAPADQAEGGAPEKARDSRKVCAPGQRRLTRVTPRISLSSRWSTGGAPREPT